MLIYNSISYYIIHIPNKIITCNWILLKKKKTHRYSPRKGFSVRERGSPTRHTNRVCANKGGRYKRPAFTMLRVTFGAKAHFDDWLSVFVLMYSIIMPLRPQIATTCYFCMVLLAIVVIFTVDNGAAKRKWLFMINNLIINI